MQDVGSPRRYTESGVLMLPTGRLLGVLVSSTNGGSFELREDAQGKVIIGRVVLPVGWHGIPVACGYRAYVAIDGELDVTFVVA